MENSNMHSFSIGKQITKFHIPGNGVIINGMPEIKKEPILSETEILKSKIELLESEIQKTREESYEEGFNACKRSLEDKNNEELNSQKDIVLKLKSNLEKEVKETVSNIYQPIVEISKSIASKILNEELDSSQKWINSITSNIEDYCNETSDQINLNVKVNSDCIQFLQNGDVELENIDLNLINFVADDNLLPGECVIESNNHIVDATFQTQINHIVNNIF
jgi:flagellar biosynthesis/type III secretory pathway protein FliH